MAPVTVGDNMDQPVALLDAAPLEGDDLGGHDVGPELLTELPELRVQVANGHVNVVKTGRLAGKG